MEIKIIDIVSNVLCNHAAAAISFSAHRRFERGDGAHYRAQWRKCNIMLFRENVISVRGHDSYYPSVIVSTPLKRDERSLTCFLSVFIKHSVA